jgi:hypothetical protein
VYKVPPPMTPEESKPKNAVDEPTARQDRVDDEAWFAQGDKPPPSSRRSAPRSDRPSVPLGDSLADDWFR